MQTANCLVAIGGDDGNKVPKYSVTAAEVAVLRLIHGEGSVSEINITGTVERTHRQEIGRLTEAYGRMEGEKRVSPAVSSLYPGAAARVFEDFRELEIPEEFYVAKSRKTARDPLDHDGDGKKGGSRTDEEREDMGLEGMTVNELRALSEKEQVDLTGVTKKADIIEAIEVKRASAAEDEADDEVGEINDEQSEENLFE